MGRKRKKKRELDNKMIIGIVVILVLLFILAMVYQESREMGEEGLGELATLMGVHQIADEVPVRTPVVYYSFDSKTIGSYSKVKNEIPSLPWMVHESGNPSFIQGRDGSSLRLDEGDKVKVLHNPGLKDLLSNDKFALSFWIKDITTVSIQKKKGRKGFRVNTDRDGNLRFNTFGEGSYLAVVCPIDSSDWKHVIITAESGGSKSMYINGRKCAESQEAGIFNSNPTNNVRIVGNFSGIDDIKMWNRDFSPENALAAFQGNDPSGIVVRYSFGELEGDFDSNVIIKNEIAKLPELLEESGTLSFVEGDLGTTGLNLKVEDGVQDKFKIKHSDGLKKLMVSNEVTVSFRVKGLKDLSIEKRTRGDGFRIAGNSNVIRFKVGTEPAVICDISPVVDSDIRDEEIHVAVTARRNGDAIVYINGVECARREAGPNNLNAGNNFRGRGEVEYIDEINIWNVVLSDGEIRSVAGISEPELGLTNHYNFFKEIFEDTVGDAGGTPVGDVRFEEDSLFLDGDGDYIEIGNIPLSNEMTISSWIRTNSIEKQGIIKRGLNSHAAKHQEFALYIENGIAKLAFGDGSQDSNVIGGLAVNDGEWHMITGVLTAGGTIIKLYVDRELVASSEKTVDWEGNANTNLIGSFKRNAKFFEGYIWSIKIWNYPLTDYDIAWETKYDRPTLEPILISQFPFNEDFRDFTGDNDGTPVGNARIEDRSLVLDGNGDYVEIGNVRNLPFDLALVNQITMKASIRTNSIEKQGIIKRGLNSHAAKHQQYALYTENGIAKLAFGDGSQDSNILEGGIVNDGEWHTIMGVWRYNDEFERDNKIELYVDGQLVDSVEKTVDWRGISNTQIIGSFKRDAKFFDGKIKDVKIWNYALSKANIRIESLIDLNINSCKEVIPNHNNLDENRANLVFVTFGFNGFEEEDLEEAIRQTSEYLIDIDGERQGMFSVEPFKTSGRDKFNFWYIDQTLPLDTCEYFYSRDENDNIISTYIGCPVGVLESNCVFPNKYVNFLINVDFRSNAPGNSMRLSTNIRSQGYCPFTQFCSSLDLDGNNCINEQDIPGDSLGDVNSDGFVDRVDRDIFDTCLELNYGCPDEIACQEDLNINHNTYLNYVFMHELGHSFGNLRDEYIEIRGTSVEFTTSEKNCYAGPLHTLNECIDNSQWKDLIGDDCGEEGVVDCVREVDENYNLEISCFESCFYEEYGIYRSTFNNIMRAPWLDPYAYGKWNEQLIMEQLRLYGN